MMEMNVSVLNSDTIKCSIIFENHTEDISSQSKLNEYIINTTVVSLQQKLDFAKPSLVFSSCSYFLS